MYVLLKIWNISGILKMGCTMKGPTVETNGRINSADLGSSSMSLFLVSSLIINASLYPVKIPRLIVMFHSDNGVPIDSILFLMDCSILDNIAQLDEVSKDCSVSYC